ASHQPLGVYFPDNYQNSEYDNYRGIQLNIPLDVLTIMNMELVQNIHERSAYLAHTKAFSRPGIIKNLYRKLRQQIYWQCPFRYHWYYR
ncbi:MAG TPA: hypothetical protein VLB84_19060, partial [Bacteroidia bacterium]|nr:hypothetical protein [Bacteroidia bacterium]